MAVNPYAPSEGECQQTARLGVAKLEQLLVKAQREINREQLVAMLQEIVRNDTTRYDHHEARRWDGRTPDSKGGTIWLTPKEMARQALRYLGEPQPYQGVGGETLEVDR